MSINEPDLEPHIREIRRAESRINYLMREGKEATLFMELSNLERAANRAQLILNEIRYRKEAK